jgi:hypothetical protein
MDYVLDNLWWSNSNNLCVPMYVPILYVVFQRMYNVHKPVRTICMILLILPDFYLCFQFYMAKVCIICTNQWKQYVCFLLILSGFSSHGSTKTALVNRQNRLVYLILVCFTDSIKKIPISILYRFLTGFYRFFYETDKTGPVRFLKLYRFFKPCSVVYSAACSWMFHPPLIFHAFLVH